MPVITFLSPRGRRRDRDALGSVVATYKDGWLTADRSYDPYGETRAEWNDVGRFGWVGGLGYRETRREWVTHYVRARHYGYPMGMWTSVDPLWPSEPAFGYVGGRATKWSDPSGRNPACLACGACLGLTALAAFLSCLGTADPVSCMRCRVRTNPGYQVALFGCAVACTACIPGIASVFGSVAVGGGGAVATAGGGVALGAPVAVSGATVAGAAGVGVGAAGLTGAGVGGAINPGYDQCRDAGRMRPIPTEIPTDDTVPVPRWRPCPPRKCPPCGDGQPVFVRTDRVPPGRWHFIKKKHAFDGMWGCCPTSHSHYYRWNQNPITCQCRAEKFLEICHGAVLQGQRCPK